MKTQSMLLAALASVPAALAHTVFTEFSINGVPQGPGVAMRMSNVASEAGSPIASLDSDDMACNVGGTKGVSRVQSVPDGALLSFQIHSWADDPTKQPLDRGHYGPCAVYAKKVSSAIEDRGAGDGWFKLFDHGYNADTKRWCSDEIIDNKGLLNINLPKGLAGGAYLIRPEILALHNAFKGDPQFYTGCAQIFLESTGDLGPESTVSIPGYVAYDQPSTNFNIYEGDASKYTIPGPSIAKLVAKSSVASKSSTQTEGLKPEGCIVENANWCGIEVSSYSDEKGCWAAGEACWAQHKTCWADAPPTGGSGCELMQAKCEGIQNACSSKNFNGPPNKGKVLTPEVKSIDVGIILATVGGGVYDSPKTSASATKQASKTETPAYSTPVADKEDVPAQSYAQTTFAVSATPAKTSAAAPAAKPSSAAAPQAPAPTYATTPKDEPESDDEDDKPAYTITVPVPTPGAPTPTKAPKTCPKGCKCVTVTEVDVVTQTVYVTDAYDSYKRSAASFRQRRRHAHHM